MPTINVNTSGVPDAAPKAQPGNFIFQITQIDEVENVGQNDTPLLPIHLRIVEAEDEDQGDCVGAMVTDRLFFKDREDPTLNSIRFKQFLMAQGEHPDELTEIDTGDMLGVQVRGRVWHEPYTNKEGKLRNATRIAYLPPDGRNSWNETLGEDTE